MRLRRYGARIFGILVAVSGLLVAPPRGAQAQALPAPGGAVTRTGRARRGPVVVLSSRVTPRGRGRAWACAPRGGATRRPETATRIPKIRAPYLLRRIGTSPPHPCLCPPEVTAV